MEVTKEEGFLAKIRPPLLEDAGLEDCALPPDAIKEAFLKAATAVRSVISAPQEAEDDHCLNDPWPTIKDSSDILLGIKEGADSLPGGCSAVKGFDAPDLGGDQVAVIGADDVDGNEDVVVVGDSISPEEGKACVDGLQGLKIEEKSDEDNNKKLGESGCNDDVEEENEEEKPILAEVFV